MELVTRCSWFRKTVSEGTGTGKEVNSGVSFQCRWLLWWTNHPTAAARVATKVEWSPSDSNSGEANNYQKMMAWNASYSTVASGIPVVHHSCLTVKILFRNNQHADMQITEGKEELNKSANGYFRWRFFPICSLCCKKTSLISSELVSVSADHLRECQLYIEVPSVTLDHSRDFSLTFA